MRIVRKTAIGEDLSRYSKDSLCPQTRFKKALCLRKHCTERCAQESGEGYKFWAFVLSNKPADHRDLARHLRSLDNELRISVWRRFADSKVEYRTALSYESGDSELVGAITKLCAANVCSPSLGIDTFGVYKNILRFCSMPRNDVFVIRLIVIVLSLPHSDASCTFEVMYAFFCTLGYGRVFECSGALALLSRFMDSETMIPFLDICMCLRLSLDDFQMYSSREDTRIERLASFSSGLVRDSKEGDRSSELDSYFVFLAAQNKSRDAYESMKEKLSGKIEELERKNENLAEGLESMEVMLKAFNEQYLHELKVMLDDLRTKYKRLEQNSGIKK